MSDYADKIAERVMVTADRSPSHPLWTQREVEIIASMLATAAREGYELASGVKS